MSVGREQPVGNHLNVIRRTGPPSTELGIHCRGLLAHHRIGFWCVHSIPSQGQSEAMKRLVAAVGVLQLLLPARAVVHECQEEPLVLQGKRSRWSTHVRRCSWRKK